MSAQAHAAPSDPAEQVTLEPVDLRGVGNHPLAHRRGIVLFDQILAGSMAWDGRRGMTAPQRDLVAGLLTPLLDGTGRRQVTLPELPADVRDATVASLRGKGLVDPDGRRLTPLALLAAQHGPRLAAQRRESRGEGAA